MKIDDKAIIDAYNKGQSMNSIAKSFGTYAATVKRVLEKNHIVLRHDVVKKGTIMVQDGEKLIEWAKAQGRLVTKAELAEVLGKKKLSPSYFIKYPELGKYIASREQKDIQEYTQKLYKWLKENNISYKPNDRTKLKVSVDALLLEEYEGLAFQVAIKPMYVSSKTHYNRMQVKRDRAKEVGITLLFLNKEHFESLDGLTIVLEDYKKIKER